MTEPTLRQHKISRYGWQPDLPDVRDHLYGIVRPTLLQVPANVDLRSRCPPVYDQGQLGSCTGNAIAGAVQFDRLKQGLKPDFIPSRLFIYYNERVIERTVSQDAGAMIRDGFKSIARSGACPEADWPYNVNHFATKPPAKAYTDALQHKAVTYSRLTNTLPQLQDCLAAGYPFVFGFSVYESFESDEVAKTGVLPQLPGLNEQMLGGHAVMAVGYDEPSSRFIVRNSWGPNWGQAGYFTMHYDYITNQNLCDDFWTVRVMST